jgi:predicted hydrolase (HD superfamily)
MNVMPKTPLEWAIYTSDELTGFIVAVTLIRPSKKIADVTVENVLSKWDKKDFAKGVNRNQIELCEEKLGIKLPDFIQIVLDSMKNISSELGL